MTIDRAQVDTLLNLVTEQYPDWQGFSDPRFVSDEINYKRATAAKAQNLLSADALNQLIQAENFDEIIARLKKVGQDNNLLFHGAPRTGDLAILHQAEVDKRALTLAVYDLLHGSGPSPQRLDQFRSFVRQSKLPNKWVFPLYFTVRYLPHLLGGV
jgi:hypothetical protein